MRAYRQNRNVLYAEPNYIYHALTTPNDPKFSQLWGLQNTGQNLGTAGADIHAPQAWSLSTGSSNVVVAMIDTGIDYNHEDLRANVWSNPTSYSATIDGVSINCAAGTHGFNAVKATCDPLDDNGHGTHVSGTIGAVGNNGIGVAGVNWSVQILACKFLDASGGGTLSDAITCLDFVKAMKDRGANIVATNNSWGGGGFSQALSDAIQAQQKDGILFIAAAGNDSSDNDLVPTYPSDYFLPNVISVAATTRFDWLADFSNTGAHTVHLGAPGQEILSTTPNNTYSVLSGTSMATPHVTGVTALLAAQNPSRDWRAIKNLIVAGGDAVPALTGTITGKRLNAYGSMTCSNSVVAKRLQPMLDTLAGSVGQPITLAAININCAQPAGQVMVTVSPGSQQITLTDNGTGLDQAAGDGIYSGTWTPSALGDYVLSFSTGGTVQVTVLNNYVLGGTPYSYQTIAGTNLNLADDELATVTAPFPVQFGGGSFTQLYVSSNGTISFTNAFDDFLNFDLPVNTFLNGNPQNSPPPVPLRPVVTLVAPLWQDLYPVKGTNQNVFWAVTGAAPNRQLVVEWRNVRTFDCRGDSTANVTFEVVFSESGSSVYFNYANTQFVGACSSQNFGQAATIGIQVTQNLGVQWGADQTSIDSGISLVGTLAPSNPAPNPAPTVTSVSPASIPTGSGDTWLTLTGTNFVPSSQASFYPYVLAVTEYISATQLKVLLPAVDLVYPSGTPGIQINVTNPTPGGGTSPAVYVIVVGQSSPQITSISPTSVPAGSFGFILTVNGSGFIPYATNVLFNGNGGQTTVVNGNQVTFAVTGAMVQTAGTIPVQVQVGPTTFTDTVSFTITPATTPATIQAPLVSATSTNQTSPTKQQLTAQFLTGRFLGWKAAQFLGQAYTAKYQRELARLAPAVANTRAGASDTHNLAASATIPPAPAAFNLRPTLPAGFIPTAVITGDFNGDGKLDWAVANGGDNSIWIYLGNGDGTAKLPTIVQLQGHAPVALATADMNGDGKLDLVVAEADSLAVAVLLGNGDGTFGPELTFTTPSIPISLAVADFNGDGKLDVVVGLLGTVNTGQLAFLPGDGTGKLGMPVIHYGQVNGAVFLTFAISAADLNGDGLPDIVALDFTIDFEGLFLTDQFGSAGARAYVNQGNGIFKMTQQFFHDQTLDQSPPLGLAVTAVALGDVNGDGCVDAVTLDSLGTATFFPGLCDGNFDTTKMRIFGSGIVAEAAALADVNGDGRLDLISSASPFTQYNFFGSAPAGSVSVQFGDGTGNFGSPTLYRGEPEMVSLAVTDLKKNGRPEIITVNQQTDTITVYQNDGTGAFGPPKGRYVGYLMSSQMHAVGNAPLSNFAVKDLNGDGRPDLATLEIGSQYPLPTQMTVLLNNGTGGYGAPILTPIADVTNPVNDFIFADFRNTGRKDLLFIGATTQLTYGFAISNGDGTFQKPVLKSLPLTIYVPVHLVLGDFNNDGKQDFLIVGSGGFTPFLGNGDGTFSQGTTVNFPTTGTQSPDIRGAIVADVNGDGKADLLMLGSQLLSSTGQFAIYELLGNGNGTFQTPKLLFNNLGPFAVVDLNKDGRPDIVAAVDQGMNATVFGHLWVYEVFIGNGDGSFTPGQTYGPFPNPYADFYYAEYLFGPADQPLGALQPMVGDFNGDGIPDVAVYTTAGTNVSNAIGYAGAPLSTQVFVLAGNGDGTFSIPSLSQGLGGLLVPQGAADLNGDGRTDLIEMDAYTSSFTSLTATNGASFSVGLVSDPVIGTTGKLRIILTYASSSATTLQLSASDPNIVIPTSVTILAGSVSQDVAFQIGSGFNSNHVFSLTATLGAESHTAYGTQAPTTQVAGFVALLQQTSAPVIVAGQSTPDYGLLVGSVGGYSTQIVPTCQGLPSGAACQFGANPIVLPPGGTVADALVVSTASNLPPGQYSFTVNLTDGVVTRTLSAAFNVGDFSMSITPASQTIGTTDFTAYTLNLQSINGYGQAIQPTCSGLPSGTVCPFGNVPYFPGSQENPFQIHTQNAIPGTYNFTITGTSGSLVHTASAQLIVSSGNFSGSISPVSATISVGGAHDFNVQLNSLSNFQGQVSLSCVSPPNGISCQFALDPISVNPNVASTSTLTLSVTTKPASTTPFTVVPRGIFTPNIRILLTAWMLLVALALFLVINTWWRGIWDELGIRPVALWTVSILLLVAVGIVACGGGSTTGGGGGGGGNPAIVHVVVQGSSGNTTISLGTLTITVP
ncbi:MAG TPA: FG-GAP-like repeat-containing protein [Candidatus Limnocylindria bacterium]|nr:FG-GAP-like repeat-containing protein [Candidatus Limnocylindria bacterium]